MRAQNVKPFDLGRLEDEVQDVVQQRRLHIQPIEHAPHTPTPPVPDYVHHREGVPEIGKLAAEAIVKEYEAAAKEIEAMGESVNEMMQRCEQLATSASATLRDIKTTAMRYRKEGERMFNEIESCSTATDEVRKLCETFRDKLTVKVPEGAA